MVISNWVFPLLLVLTSALLFPCESLYSSSSYLAKNFRRCFRVANGGIYAGAQTYLPDDVLFGHLLNSTAQNLRYLGNSYAKPKFIFLPSRESHVRTAFMCFNSTGIHFRVRSGGHDYEGVSYVSQIETPFAIIDLHKLRHISVDVVSRTAWVQAGATIGEVYYRVAEKSDVLAFPAGIYTSLGIGGHITGGAYGAMMRMHGLGADNVLDARILVSDGRILNRRSMGEDLFWAIRGGGGGSFGIILGWKLKLVTVPPNVTVFTVVKTTQQDATSVLHRWQQVVDKIDRRLFIRVIIEVEQSQPGQSSGRFITTIYSSLFLGSKGELLDIMQARFPELGLTDDDCTVTSWIQAVMYIAGYPSGTKPEVLLDGKSEFKNLFKAKSDYVKQPLSVAAIEGMWQILLREENPMMTWVPYGGRMSQINESSIPFPHRKGNIFKIQYVTTWKWNSTETARQHENWLRMLYRYMAPYVSSNPRTAYVNYRDLDLGMNSGRGDFSTYQHAISWGTRYFKGNFLRLLNVKAKVDPENIFRHEQSIPILN